MKQIPSKIFSGLLSQTAKDTYWVFGSNILSAILAFVYIVFITRKLGPSEFGVFSSIFAYSLLISDIAEFGIGSSLSRFLPPLYSRNENGKALSFLKTSFIFILKIALIVSIGTIIFSGSLSEILLTSYIYSFLYIIAGFFIFGLILLSFNNYALSAQKKFVPVATLSFLTSLIKVILIAIFYFLEKLNLLWTIVIFAFSAFPVYILSFKFLKPEFIKAKEEKGNLRRLLSYTTFLGFSRLFSAVSSRLDILMLVPLSSTFEGGIYSGAFKIASLYIMLSGSFGSVIAPRLAGFASKSEAYHYLKKVILATGGIIVSILFAYLISPWIVVFILGDKYELSVPVFQTLLIPMALFVMSIPPVSYLLYTLKKPQVSTINTVMQLIIVFTGNYFLIPKYGSYGPVISLGIAYFISLIVSSSFAYYYHKKNE
ncbi:hypothetical protein A2Y99_02960 [Candidatus Gottesmanbacteria bacterium RBG_13_37_7]|uniref:Uncharacterized protein n=1 Tax=Candidatus Gottesmanbacteria bacterium RBG_13_37_7 TaxID=1798369 RepID=A0A1F5YKG4_9BACT|nr:MAG: hypothetical protein A2Y99_02960 [Candidatus Gottesmanbacteria bacterium RBG_13_37_7]